jgi:Flp pilus assembly protein protease CpaA
MGAILAFAVTADVSGVEIATVGWILMIAGAVGFLLSLLFRSTRGGVGTWRCETIVRRDPYDQRPPY